MTGRRLAEDHVDAAKAALLDSAANSPFVFRLRCMSATPETRPVYENLDTSYVNLAALLRYLRERGFVGHVHVELDDYAADVFLSAQGDLDVRETDRAMGREAKGDAALQRLIVRASTGGGLINVYQAVDQEAISGGPSTTSTTVQTEAQDAEAVPQTTEPEGLDWTEILRLSGEIIAAIERAALGLGGDFNTAFRAARLELADDYSFLDPATGRFEYAHSEVQLHGEPSVNAYISGISECLRRVVEKLAASERGGSLRERVALGLAVLARRRQSQFERLKLAPQLDRIAGTRVL